MNCKKHVLVGLREFFHSQGIFSKDWIKNTNTYIRMSLKQNQVRDQILAIENGDKKE